MVIKAPLHCISDPFVNFITLNFPLVFRHFQILCLQNGLYIFNLSSFHHNVQFTSFLSSFFRVGQMWEFLPKARTGMPGRSSSQLEMLIQAHFSSLWTLHYHWREHHSRGLWWTFQVALHIQCRHIFEGLAYEICTKNIRPILQEADEGKCSNRWHVFS